MAPGREWPRPGEERRTAEGIEVPGYRNAGGGENLEAVVRETLN